MKLHEEFKLFETMWDDAPSSEASTENRYIILTGDFPNKYYVHGLTSDGEKEAVDIYNKAMAQLPNFDCDIEVAELFDLTSDEISRLESMVGKEVTDADADFIADFFIDGSRADSRYNNFSESKEANKTKLAALTEADTTSAPAATGCGLEELITHMSKWGRCPKLPFGWMINEILDDDDVSIISFEHKRLPISAWFWVKYYMGDSYANSKYEIAYELQLDSEIFEHASEDFKPTPEDCVKRIFEIVNECNAVLEKSKDTPSTFIKNLMAAGYKKA